MLTAIRSLAFTLVFYSGSLFFVLAALLLGPFSTEAVLRIGTGWSRFHRLCAHW